MEKFIIYASKFYWRLHPTVAGWSGRFSAMPGTLRIQHVSLQNACTWTVCRWFRRNTDHHQTLQIWTLPADIISGQQCTKLCWKLHRKRNTVSESKVALEKTREIFRRTKLSRVLERGWESRPTWSLVEIILSSCCNSKVFILMMFALVLNAIWCETIFDDVMASSCHV